MNAHLVPIVVLWCVVVGRVSMLRRPGTSRVLWVTLAFLALAQTLQLKSVYDWTNDVTGSAVGASVLKLSLAVVACAGLRTLISTLPGRVSPSIAAARAWVIAAAAIVVVCVPVLLSPPQHVAAAAVAHTQFYDSTWRSLVVWLPFLGYLSWAMAGGVSLFWTYGGQAPDRKLATGLRLVATGCALGFVYVALKVAVLAVWHIDVPAAPAWMNITEGSTGEAVLAACIILIAIGSAWEAVTRAANAARNFLWARWALWRLRPLWAVLVAQHPEIALDDTTPSPVRRATYRLLRRVVEIRDGILALEQSVDAAMVSEATTRVEAAGYHGDDAAAMILAIMVSWSTRHRPARPGGAVLPAGGGTDLESEVRWLTKVAKNYRKRTLAEPATTDQTPAT